jgi:hypothetical protein
MKILVLYDYPPSPGGLATQGDLLYRDLMIAGLAALVTKHPKLMASLRRVLETLAKNQTSRGHIPSLVHDGEDRGASDTTPLFLLTTAFYRMATVTSDSTAPANTTTAASGRSSAATTSPPWWRPGIRAWPSKSSRRWPTW